MELALNQGMIPIGLLRERDVEELGNEMPFVFTNPPPSLVLRGNDLVYVIH